MKQPKQPILFSALGAPGSGKTFFSKAIAKHFGFVHLNSDCFRLEMFEKPTYKTEETRVLVQAMDLAVKEILESGHSVISDANHSLRARRKELEQVAIKSDGQHCLLWIKTPEETALKRLRDRRIREDLDRNYYRPTSSDVFHDMKKEIEIPIDENFLIIDGEKDTEQAIEIVKKYLESLP